MSVIQPMSNRIDPLAPDPNTGEWRVVYDPQTSHPESYHIQESGNGDCIAHAGTERYATQIVADHVAVPRLVEALEDARRTIHDMTWNRRVSGRVAERLQELTTRLGVALTTPATQPAAGEE